MKRSIILLLFLASFMQLSNAQTPNNLSRKCLETLEGFLTVNHGEFQAEYSYSSNMSSPSTPSLYNYLYIAKKENSGRSTIGTNGKLMFPSLEYDVRPFRIGSTWNECIVVVKYFEDVSNEIAAGMETIYANGVMQDRCDSIVSLTNDGYIAKLNGVYSYRTYKQGTNAGQAVEIVWPEKRIYKEEDRGMLSSRGVSCRLKVGDVYHCSVGSEKSDVHYYYLYKDNYMPYTVLVVDGRVVELFGEYTDEDIRLKYSYNGNHWMAVVDGYFWVDGEMKSTEGYTISDFLISMTGDYFYKAYKNGEEEKGEILVMNGEIIRQQVITGHFALNAQQRLRFHFLAAGQWYVYDNGQISSVAKESNSVVYTDDLIDNLSIERMSPDGKHKMSYVTGRKGVTIDGVMMTESVPFQVVYDKEAKCFRWNAIEKNSKGLTELVVYKYAF